MSWTFWLALIVLLAAFSLSFVPWPYCYNALFQSLYLLMEAISKCMRWSPLRLIVCSIYIHIITFFIQFISITCLLRCYGEIQVCLYHFQDAVHWVLSWNHICFFSNLRHLSNVISLPAYISNSCICSFDVCLYYFYVYTFLWSVSPAEIIKWRSSYSFRSINFTCNPRVLSRFLWCLYYIFIIKNP